MLDEIDAIRNNSELSDEEKDDLINTIRNKYSAILNDAEVDYIRNGYSNGLKGTLNLSFRGKDGEAILHRLDLRGILVSTGSACDSNSVQVSHVIKAINVPDSYAKGTIRISLGKDNTIEEAKIIGETLVSVLMEQK